MSPSFFDRFKNTGKSPAQSSQKGEDGIKIGIVACKSGPAPEYGLSATRGFELGIEYATNGANKVLGKPIQLMIEDDQGNPDISQVKARALIEQEHVDILQGCTLSEPTIRISRIAQDHKRIFMIAVAATDVLTNEWFNPYLFRTAASTSQDAAAGSKYAVEKLGRTFYFLTPDTIWGQQSRAAWWRVIQRLGGEIVGDLILPPDMLDFRSVLREVKAKKPDVFIPFWAGSAVMGLLMQTYEEGVLAGSRLVGNLVDTSTVRAVGEALNGMVCAAKYYHAFPSTQTNDWLVSRHQELYNANPDLLTEGGFTSGLALVEALWRTKGKTDAETLIPTLEEMSFLGPKGAYTFRKEDHQALQPMYIAELKKQPGENYCTPQLIGEISAEEAAPAITRRS